MNDDPGYFERVLAMYYERNIKRPDDAMETRSQPESEQEYVNEVMAQWNKRKPDGETDGHGS